MNIYLIQRTDKINWDEYDSFVCLAESEEIALSLSPMHYDKLGYIDWKTPKSYWTRDIKNLKCVLIGKSEKTEREIVCASYNAG